jgi:hypothetical protein
VSTETLLSPTVTEHPAAIIIIKNATGMIRKSIVTKPYFIFIKLSTERGRGRVNMVVV